MINKYMTIAIIVAMDKELRLLIPLLENEEQKTIGDVTFHCGTVSGKNVVAMKCGIGKVNAALAATRLIETFSPDLVINTGVAGGAGGGASIMDVVIGERVAYHDVWCGPGTEWGQAAGCPLYFTSADDVVAKPCLHNDDTVKHGLVCSGDIFVDSPAVVEGIKAHFPDVMAVDMESAAIAQACYKKQVPFVCLRVVSDTPGDDENNIAQYENFWEEAPERTFHIIKQLLSEL